MSIIFSLGLIYSENIGASAINSPSTNNTTTQAIAMTNTVITSAQSWNLTSSEWQRYQNLMRGPSGKWYPTLDPLEVLGIQARDDRERNFYAEEAVKIRQHRIANELAFNRAVNQAWKKLYPQLKPVEDFPMHALSPLYQTHLHLMADDHLILLLQINGNEEWVIPPLLTALREHPSVTLDIYLVDKNLNERVIQEWAKKQKLPLDLLAEQRMTLNEGNQQYAEIAALHPVLPLVLLVRQNQTKRIALANLG